MANETKPSCCCGSQEEGGEDRRCFCCRMMSMLAGLVLLIPSLAAGAWSLVSPLFVRKAGGRQVRVTTLESLPADGTPQKFPIIADRRDAWTQYPSQPIGAVFVRRVKDKAEALQVVCPHAGCFVAYSAEKKNYYCPCHVASFDLEGKRVDPSKCDSPRDMDKLEVEIRNNADVFVTFKKFRTGTPQQIEES